MPFNVLGINHKTAPVELRERVAFGPEKLLTALHELRHESGIAEVVILSTCNRTELYWIGMATGTDISDWLERHHAASLDLASCVYVHRQHRAVEHVFNVASGLDSMVLGEAQILGQLKESYRIAQEAGCTGSHLNRLFQAAFSVAKRVRSQTQIGANAVSMASATVRLARRVYEDLSAKNALFIGAGEMNSLTARHFAAAGIKRLVIANRTLSRAQELAAEIKGYAVGLDQLAKELTDADIVVSCTASPTALITKALAEAALRARRRRPMFMMDFAVPRDIEPAVADLEDVYLFSIDDLQQLVNESRQQREAAAGAARLLIHEEVARFVSEARTKEAGPAIRALRQEADAIRQQTLEQARRMLASGKSAHDALDYLANTLTNRLLHAPTQALRQASTSAESVVAAAVARARQDERDRK
jgi:glutamyl-tRNA reductase